jgi:YgiT-type zinc finger domain-containing protein
MWMTVEKGRTCVDSDALKTGWRKHSDVAIETIVSWREQHRRATFQEIESAIDNSLAQLRARMLEDAALVSAVTDLRAMPEGDRPKCPVCGTPVKHHKRDKRTLLTQYNKTVTLERSYAICPHCGEAFFPPR